MKVFLSFTIVILLLFHTAIIACTVISFSNPDLKLVGRNWDFGDNENAIQFIPENQHNPAMVLFLRKHYVTDGINQHGLCIAFTGVPDSPRRFIIPFKRWNISVHIIRNALKQCKNTDEVKDFFHRTSIWWGRPFGQQISFLVADSTGKSCIIDYIDKKMVLTEMIDSVLLLLNHHPTRPDILYKRYGCGFCEREPVIRKSIESANVFSEGKLMSILSKVSITDGVVKDFEKVSGRIPWGLNTAFSNVYNLSNATITTVSGRNYDKKHLMNLHSLMTKCKTSVRINMDNYNGESSFTK